MTSIPLETSTSYDKQGFYYLEKAKYTIDIKAYGTSGFYRLMKWLSILITFGFLSLLILSITSSITLHWSIGLVGLLGSIGLSGAIWLSSKLINN